MFNNIIGHELSKKELSLLVNSADPTGTYLFSGPPSVGKRTVAYETARYILCTADKGDDCSCQSCKLFKKDHPDFLGIREDRVKVENIENLLTFISSRPFISNRKVAVIDNVDSATTEAANRLLKTLEEPYKDFSFILVSADPGAIMPTVLSRCIEFKFNALNQEDLINVLFQKIGFELPKARILGWIGSGSPTDIFTRGGLYLKYRTNVIEFVTNVKQMPLIDALDWVDKVDRKELNVFSEMFLLIVTDMILLKNKINDIINADERDNLATLSEDFNDKALVAASNHLSQVNRYSRLNINLNGAFKNILIKIHPMLQAGVKR